ncbi:spermatogenesis-associated protein 22 [Dromiciops gliroides]|uniref:spermatogenesis-associated protein 22 n=1 Tax=Dromiciops gliroides TaxID=33562 RepID=UPI001CC36554|nr:spermatogenesis-associated protein 22 [Dromiciops gliroides]
MKKSVPGGSGRLTAGCLPVPLFNQKRARQPFMSSPEATSDNQDFPPLPTDFVWEMPKPEVPLLKKTMNSGQQSPTVPHLKQESQFKPDPLDVSRSHNWSSWSYREDSSKAWDRNEFTPQTKSSCSVADSGPRPGLGTMEMNQKLRQSERAQVEVQRAVGSLRMAGAQGLGNSSRALQVAKCNSQQSQLKRKTFGNGLEEKAIKEAPVCPLMLKGDNSSLRILPAVIESMKHWKERMPHCPLLFEVLAVLDSAVTPGAHGAKTFLLRDGKNTVPSVFYEIDRELPRLIRGRVHRCVGSYDQKRGLFRCVSVRPASASEQKTFGEFVRNADSRMSCYISARNEM